MNYLGIDTSGDYLAVVARKDEREKLSFTRLAGVKHSQTLMDEVEKVVLELGAEISDFEVFSCVVGPGSFTGIRIGVATVKGLADALGKRVLGVTAFDAIAYTEREGKVLAIVDAKHGNYYAAGYNNGEISFPPRFVSSAELDELQKEYTLCAALPVEGLPVKVTDVACGLALATEERRFDSVTTEQLKPFYLRLSQAEEGRK